MCIYLHVRSLYVALCAHDESNAAPAAYIAYKYIVHCQIDAAVLYLQLQQPGEMQLIRIHRCTRATPQLFHLPATPRGK